VESGGGAVAAGVGFSSISPCLSISVDESEAYRDTLPVGNQVGSRGVLVLFPTRLFCHFAS